AECSKKITEVEFGMRDLIQIAKRSEYGVRYIFVSTLTPPGPYGESGKDRRIGNDAILSANTRIANVIRSEGVTLVDTYPRFIRHAAEYVEQGGLYLGPAGSHAR